MRILILGLTITSSWGNGHATTYRSLCRALHERGHRITFVEKDVPWYRDNRDMPSPEFCNVELYSEWAVARRWLCRQARAFDLVIVGSYFPDGVAAAELLFEEAGRPVFFYDIDTPITVQRLRSHGSVEAIAIGQIRHYDCYLSFTGGPMLRTLEREFGARRAEPLYCSVDADVYRPLPPHADYACDLSYLGTYSADRQPKLEKLLNAPARALPDLQFVVAGAQYPDEEIEWPCNVARIQHVAPAEHPRFYSSSRFTLNLTRDAMVAAGYSPSVRLFEAAACGSVILSDAWEGIDEFFDPGSEILIASKQDDVTTWLRDFGASERAAIGEAARTRILERHTHLHRACELEHLAEQACGAPVLASASTPIDAVAPAR